MHQGKATDQTKVTQQVMRGMLCSSSTASVALASKINQYIVNVVAIAQLRVAGALCARTCPAKPQLF
jgi:hypothetical protein